MNLRGLFLLFLGFTFFDTIGQAEWTGESWGDAENLTQLNSWFQEDLSGAHWDEVKKELWLSINGGGKVVKLSIDNEVVTQEKTWDFKGDFEGITLTNSDSTFFVLDEEFGVKEYANNQSDKTPLKSWDLRSFFPSYIDGKGPEGITFIPNSWLSNNVFKDGNGNEFQSSSDLQGIILIAHQKNGIIYAFEINRSDESSQLIGKYKTSRTGAAGLEFDRKNGLLFILHNNGINYVEISDLSSVESGVNRKFNSLIEFNAPHSGNLEGIAMADSGNCWLTQDDGDDESLMWFKEFTYCMNASECSEELSTSNIELINFSVSPNPFRESFVLNAQENLKSYMVFDPSGKIVHQNQNVIGRSTEISINGVEGIYFLKVQFESGLEITTRVIKQ